MIHQASSSLTGNYKTADRDLMPLAKDLMDEVGNPIEGRFSGLEHTPGKRITLLRVKLVKHSVKQSALCLPERSKIGLNGQLRNQKGEYHFTRIASTLNSEMLL
ncbi:vesicle transport protein GOT1B [Platysternon megacephalum]|uniref:Vesicle transport protein GOT1B n=1 Tax=Platysternon megacephalum TaxID=55544 RepID=A0A4D9E9T5_9SAUR|nr:vesicle transport protein GOT1B [Platysternon megacephalum]